VSPPAPHLLPTHTSLFYFPHVLPFRILIASPETKLLCPSLPLPSRLLSNDDLYLFSSGILSQFPSKHFLADAFNQTSRSAPRRERECWVRYQLKQLFQRPEQCFSAYQAGSTSVNSRSRVNASKSQQNPLPSGSSFIHSLLYCTAVLILFTLQPQALAILLQTPLRLSC
jgi:hypothetical protein